MQRALKLLAQSARTYVIAGAVKTPIPTNEPMVAYEAGSPEREALLAAVAEMQAEAPYEVPCIVNGEEIYTGDTFTITAPSDNQSELFTGHFASASVIEDAIVGALDAKWEWESLTQEQRCSIFLKAGYLASTPEWRNRLNAVTMLNLGKTMFQAEIDSHMETVDFFNFNSYFGLKLHEVQPLYHTKADWNKLEYRALEGFVAAVSPFNFTAIAANLAPSPALMGNVAIWKPATSVALMGYVLYELLREAGLPDGVIQFVPVRPATFMENCVNHPDMAGLHFTGSTDTFNDIWKLIGDNIENYRTFPKIVGETGGKNFHVLHPTGNVTNFANTSVRGAFEYSGQKCSATSRLYVPKSLYENGLRDMLIKQTEILKVGPVEDPTSFTSAVIDQRAFEKITGFIDRAAAAEDAEIVAGGTYDDSQGWFINPTLIETTNPFYESMVEEIFGPVLTIFPYEDAEFSEILELANETSEYALTGSIYAQDRYAIQEALDVLRHAAGNFYINDKSTGAMVAQQPFGGARKSGTNDKAGHEFNIRRWVSPRTIKESFHLLDDVFYPSVDHE